MHPLTHHVAVSRSLADGAPRIIVQHHAMYLVTPEGEVWQMFDTDGSGWIAGGVPRNDAAVLARIFVRADDALVRIYRFGIGERRSTTAWHMLTQLERAKLGDERAA